MIIQELELPGVFLITPVIHDDARGSFTESFSKSSLTGKTGLQFDLAQMNTSISRRNVVRGIHTADVPPGQGKYVSCVNGSIIDIVVDIRLGSPTFKRWVSVNLDSESRQSLLIPAGMGHGFRALTDNSVVNYLCDQPYSPNGEYGINPFDPDLAIDWGIHEEDALLSPKDHAAPLFMDKEIQHRLTNFETS